MIHYLQAIILGTVQGVTEFLPISSTAHLIITQKIFGLDQSTYGLTFDMFTNLGTILAVIIFFWKDLRVIFGDLRFSNKTPWLILLSTIPVGLVGLLLEKKIETSFRSLWVIVFTLVFVGFVMIAAEKFSKFKSDKPKPWQIVITSLSQILALIPGVSRSGITISTAMFSGLDRVTAARYSFMLSLPITMAATAKKLLDFSGEIGSKNLPNDVIIFYVLGAVFSFITGYLTLQFLLKFYQKYSLTSFAYYRFILAGILILIISRIGA